MSFIAAVDIRRACQADADALARVWHAAWQDAHASLIPASLAPHRTLAFFRGEVERHIPSAFVLETGDGIAGFAATDGDELSHFYLASAVRGRGVARRLLRRAEDAFIAAGILSPWLVCAKGNERARRFYERMGWESEGPAVHTVRTPDGPVDLEALRMTKTLADAETARERLETRRSAG